MKKVMGGGDVDVEDDGTGTSPKIAACEGKNFGDICTFDYQGITYGGECTSYMASAKYCSTL